MPAPHASADAMAADAIAGDIPFVGMTRSQAIAAVGRFATAAARHPMKLAARATDGQAERLRILAGLGKTQIPPGDRRFADPAWSHPLWKRLALLYLSAASDLERIVDDVGLDPKSAARAQFAIMQLTAAASPTNTLLGNPAALKRVAATRGQSFVDGARHLVHDVRHNGRMPSQVDTRPFVIGETVACTPGAVVHRTEVFELLQYAPTTPTVHERPMVVVPPQVNKYYFLDLAPGRSFVEHAVAQGLQTFMISWRNPTPEQRDWSIDTYLSAIQEAFEVAREITGSDTVNTTAFCAGGMTLLMLLSHLAATGVELVNAAALGVTAVDTTVESALSPLSSRRSLQASVAKAQRKGVVEGRTMSSLFAWVRPNDLVWNYVVNNYLLGLNPPAFDVLAWNVDSTNLPATFHAEFMDLFMGNGLRAPGRLRALGTPVDLGTVKNDLYVVGARNDHLVPWQATYAATQETSGEHRFVLSNSGHIQALVNPPGNPKATFAAGDGYPEDPEMWLESAAQQTGSWWTDWAVWTKERSGNPRKARRTLGSRSHRSVAPAPGRYVLQR